MVGNEPIDIGRRLGYQSARQNFDWVPWKSPKRWPLFVLNRQMRVKFYCFYLYSLTIQLYTCVLKRTIVIVMTGHLKSPGAQLATSNRVSRIRVCAAIAGRKGNGGKGSEVPVAILDEGKSAEHLKEISGECAGSIALECDSLGPSGCVEMVCAPPERINSAESQRNPPPCTGNCTELPWGHRCYGGKTEQQQGRSQWLYLETPRGTQEDAGRKVKQQEKRVPCVSQSEENARWRRV
ncbi:hypothetical protein XELAEV_18046288mg [Xenopus laevis]|uniref:Uncharacterized protein n=1 Tax=Xenopus laevis TaxID=8355 RepID=A0A974H0H3_XENLA|nr:hypothetical protein XELAEV_18046288mg [Xenopus laevis]